MRVLITGGAGFIGSNFAINVAQGNYRESDLVTEIIIIDSLTYSGRLRNIESIIHDPRVKFVKGDIRDVNCVNDCMENVDVVFHFAAESHVDKSINNPRIFVESNVLGTQVLLETARINDVSKFVHISTDEVYGSIEYGSWDEESPILPNSPYSASKAASELVVRSYFKTFGMQTITTRCTNNYGPRQFPEKVIPRFITNLLTGGKIPIYGTGNNVRDWLHVDDHCHGVWLAALGGKPGEVYNLGGGLEMTNLDLAQVIIQKLGFENSQIQFVEDRKGHDFRYSLNFDKAKSTLGYSPSVDFHHGIESTINWYLNNRNWWEDLIV